MYRLKVIKLYFFSILKLFYLNIKKIYYKSNFYNKKLITFIPDRIFYNPSTYLAASLKSVSNDFYSITSTAPEILWKTSLKEKRLIYQLNKWVIRTKLWRTAQWRSRNAGDCKSSMRGCDSRLGLSVNRAFYQT